MDTLRRFVTFELEESLEDSPVVMIEGARQVGKSTLAKSFIKKRAAEYVTLDDAPTLELARFDPMTFLARAGDRLLIVDEAQRLPELILPLKATVDNDRRPGRFLFTGSANLLKLPGVGDSLAGRVSAVSLKPFSMGEIDQRAVPEDFVSWLLGVVAGDVLLPPRFDTDREELAKNVCIGGYPEPVARSTPRRRNQWFINYIQRLVVNDAVTIGGNSKNLLEACLKRLAAEPAQPVVQAKLARQLGASARDAKAVLELAKTMFLIEEIPAWSSSFSNRDLKTAKSSLIDTGLAASLTGFHPEKSIHVGGMEYFGALLEQYVTQQLLAQRSWSNEFYDLFHYRTRDNQEIDLVIELRDGRLIFVEIKATQTPSIDAFKTMRNVKEKLGERVAAGVVFHTGSFCHRIHDWMFQLPISALWCHEV
ncbi:MAG: DUF4143 domain-containing protein [Corynebacterium sp.]|uniref:ATP-binding protein n=1 Tax=Corynebacterium sp. TaxID=1720 RepID=UPI0026DB0054|nr:AAA family ATPase [Corynebacterium sp.]MDO5099572.1 DUF4143 domain-containing protein [Corynebacterium sp.]